MTKYQWKLPTKYVGKDAIVAVLSQHRLTENTDWYMGCICGWTQEDGGDLFWNEHLASELMIKFGESGGDDGQ